MNDVPFHLTVMGRRFYEVTMPALVEAIERLNRNLERAAATTTATSVSESPVAPPDRGKSKVTQAGVGADAVGDRGNRASAGATRWAAQLLSAAKATSGELSPARQSGEGDRRSFRCGCRATGVRTANAGG